VLGANIDVPTPDGSASVRVPPHSRPGARLRLRGKGAVKRGGGRGDLTLRLEAVLPEDGGARLEEVAKSMEPLCEGRDARETPRCAMSHYTLREIAEILGLDRVFLDELARGRSSRPTSRPRIWCARRSTPSECSSARIAYDWCTNSR
jgi:hypothetical protein